VQLTVHQESLRECKSFPSASNVSYTDSLKRKMSFSSVLLRRTKSSIKLLRDMKSKSGNVNLSRNAVFSLQVSWCLKSCLKHFFFCEISTWFFFRNVNLQKSYNLLECFWDMLWSMKFLSSNINNKPIYYMLSGSL